MAAILLIPFMLAAYYQLHLSPVEHPQQHSTYAFLITILITLSIAAICHYFGRNVQGRLYLKESILTVVLVWVLVPALSALPFLFNHTLDSFPQAYFEMVSGYTTTGSSVLFPKKYDEQTGKEIPYHKVIEGVIPVKYEFYGTVKPIIDPANGKVLFEGVEAVGQALLFWRSFTNWLGGIGIILLFILIFPVIGVGSKVLYYTEAPGPIKDSFTPRIKENALQLFKIYCTLTVAQIFFLLITNQNLSYFDAITITFATLATGGMSTKNASIASFDNLNTEIVVMIFMILGSISFALYYYIVKGKIYKLNNPEFYLFIFIVLVSGGLCSWYIYGTLQELSIDATNQVYSWGESLRYGFFQTISAISTTGFSTANFDKWPYSAQSLILIIMNFGGMVGSTCGGLKTIRLYMLFRILQYKVESMFRPQNVRIFRIGSNEVDNLTASSVLGFFVVLVTLSIVASFLFILDGIDPETAISSTISNVNNVGFAFRMAGPTESYAFMSNFSLYLSSFLMILGRLEFYTLLAILVPAFWKENA
ncbi:MAG: potassium transporter TrkG [Parachlamydiales bacterium]